ncbi:BofC C-terminal domain-containing protein [Anaerotignum lactatifermentans]|uniref:BofC C-terminal domain-containing protein n=1 Tax=Anaerotignum lactatifermentans TaxID=160404 RepID=A0ABS2GA49_9FIRM|nr:BofC C-terminal domain-containing protein [Anaerotignum lactatifermentans]MBM6828373.1 BofC C-terminal domain-containing protein [Anaerotignum lactatifermentans]MBM6877653.1 BofC C-terminal domain-containing protein [Anaerotignum lactatifermentans]MBM6949956.1 BofC C-terminal domain-containing protein [Anaerotignum lactatifermentans]
MKVRDILLAFLVFVCFAAFGFWYTYAPQPPAQTEAEEILPAAKETVIEKETQMVYQYYYTDDDITKEQKEPAQDYLVGLDRRQLESIFQGWQLIYFSPEKVILRCSVEGVSTESYLLGIFEGYLAVYCEKEGQQITLTEKTDIPVTALPLEEQQQLQEGIRVNGEENLAKLLSDYTS